MSKTSKLSTLTVVVSTLKSSCRHLFMPRRTAAPSGPPTRPFDSVRARTIPARCFLAYSSATLLLSFREVVPSPATCLVSCRSEGAGSSVFVFWSSAIGASSYLPRVRITARSTKFSSSRIFPGQCQPFKAFITAAGTLSIRFCICFANLSTK